MFSRLTSIVRYGNFTQYPEYEVAVASCWSMLVLFLQQKWYTTNILCRIHINDVIHCHTLILTSHIPDVSACPLPTSEEFTLLP